MDNRSGRCWCCSVAESLTILLGAIASPCLRTTAAAANVVLMLVLLTVGLTSAGGVAWCFAARQRATAFLSLAS